MDGSIFLFRLFGFYFVFIGFAYLFKREFFASAIKDFFRSPGLMLLAALIALIGGLAIVLNYNVWELSAKGVVTFFGWVVLLKGIFRLYFPEWGENFALQMIKGNLSYAAGIISLVLGAWLLYHGY